MYKRHEVGRAGEDYASNYLIKNGYKIIQRNFECRQGEIDIIAMDKEEYVFIEVKTRQSFKYGAPVDAVTTKKQKHIFSATKYFLYINKLENEYIRFDVIEVYKRKNKFYINHIKKIK